MDISDLKGATYNPRMISTEATSGLDRSMKRFGDMSGIVFNQRTGQLVSGHQRVLLLGECSKIGKIRSTLDDAGEPDVDGTVARAFINSGQGRIFSLRIVDWSLQFEKEANISANNANISGQWDEKLLEPLLAEVRYDCNMFEDLRLDVLLTDIQVPEVDMDVDIDTNDSFRQPMVCPHCGEDIKGRL